VLLKSYAKTNLFLNVLSKRPDGYHDIETLFERISLADEIALRRAPSGIKIKTTSKKLPRGRANIAYRAAELLKKKCGVREGVIIEIKKNIPIAAGLGGGSSNAASVLLGLNRLWRLGLSKKELMKLALRLGSDVPFFILDTPLALGCGRGDVLKEIKAPGLKIWHCLVKPAFSISTKTAYQALKSSCLTPQKANVKMLLHSIQKGDGSSLARLLANSLEVTLNKRVATIYELKKKLLEQGALGCLMSGSGSAVFGIYPSKTSAEKAARFLRRKNKNWQVFCASTV
jgi:4-diphosphocytidyl-2-C-methyl-D-erythritol kinase